jgi:plasmid replication initiation protein
MTRKSNKNDIEITVLDGNLKDNYLVQKSEPLLLMRTVPFELGELKILDTYLARINSHYENCRTVTFTKAEYEQLMGIDKTNISTLKKYTAKMLGKVVEVPMANGYMQFVLFTCAKCDLNEYGERIIELTCSEEAKQLFFGIEQLGYLQYELKNILSLTSKYSFLLYLYLRKERYRSDWIVPLDELRTQRLDIKNEYYKEFKWFNKEILKKAVAEVNEKTDIKFSYEPKKTGRRITGINFKLIKSIEQLQDIDPNQDPNQLTFDDDKQENNYTDERLSFLAEACNNEFTEEQMQVLYDILRKIEPNSHGTARYDYLLKKYNELKYRVSRSDLKPLRSRFAYLKKIIEADVQED